MIEGLQPDLYILTVHVLLLLARHVSFEHNHIPA